VIPCYNEAKRLDSVRFRTYLTNTECARLIFVDDGSTDGTLRVLQEVCFGFEDCAAVIRSDINKGKAEAVRLGLLHALKEYPQELVGFWDADLATPLESIARFVQVLEARSDIEMVFGSRVKLLGRRVKRNAHRHYLGRVFATVVSNILQLPIYDTQCGAKLFRVSSGIGSVLEMPFLSNWVFDVEILARYRRKLGNDPHRLEQIIYEYPLECWEDVGGSKVSPFDFATAFLDLLRIWSKYLKD
jgi:dolichyl-phosphate beta-glucosyltransferase